ncbi:MAG: M20/M25/M40 family metallo-hydrolase [Lachnotalea sp.]
MTKKNKKETKLEWNDIERYAVNTQRLVNEFTHLVSIDAVSFEERKMADYLIEQLTILGFEVSEDRAGEYYNSNTGNIYAIKKGTVAGNSILFSSHMDTVEPGKNKKAIIHEDGTITSDGTSILGADDVSGIAAILEAVRMIEENKLKHRDIEILFTIGEEAYLRGSEVFDYSVIQAKEAYTLDLCGEIGTVALQAPTVMSFTLEIFGKASHAGFQPEEGINSIEIASKIISQIKQGKVDSDTTFNIGTIEGGTATNIVSDYCKIKGEIRSYYHEKVLAQLAILEKISKQITGEYAASYKLENVIVCIAYQMEETSDAVQKFMNACNELNYEISLTKTFGGSDNNNLVCHGINGLVIACGMEQVHTCKEYTNIEALIKSTMLLLKLVEREV